MELKEAIEMLKPLSKLEIYDDRYLLQEPHFDADCVRALNTVLAELDKLNKRIEYALDFAVDYDGYYNPDTKQGNVEGLAMTIDDMVDVLKGNLKGVE